MIIAKNVQFWLQELRGNTWIDYAAKENSMTALARLRDLKIEQPSRVFRCISRTITDYLISKE